MRVDGTRIVDKGGGGRTWFRLWRRWGVGGALVGAGGSADVPNVLGTVDVSKSLTRR